MAAGYKRALQVGGGGSIEGRVGVAGWYTLAYTLVGFREEMADKPLGEKHFLAGTVSLCPQVLLLPLCVPPMPAPACGGGGVGERWGVGRRRRITK